MRQDALISAEATNDATGGNIAIASPLIVGLNNSDIAVNAVQGNALFESCLAHPLKLSYSK